MLRIHDLVFDAWGRRFFDHASALVPAGAKLGVVGRNGAGKSTLFRLIKGELTPGEGDISLPRSARIGAVDQEHPATPVSSLIETILAMTDIERDRLTAALAKAHVPRIWARSMRSLDADRSRRRAGAGRRDSRRTRILGGGSGSTDVLLLWRVADARGHGGGPVRRAGPFASG